MSQNEKRPDAMFISDALRNEAKFLRESADRVAQVMEQSGVAWREQRQEIKDLRERIAKLEEYARLTEYWAGLEPPDAKERRTYIAKLFFAELDSNT